MDEAKKQRFDRAQKAVKQMQEFNPNSIARVDELGQAINFKDAVPVAKQLVELYRHLTPESIAELSLQHLDTVAARAEADHESLQSVLQFQAGTSKEQRDALVEQLRYEHDHSLSGMLPIICYSMIRTTDFKKLENNAREKNQEMEGEFNRLREAMESKDKEAEAILSEIRKTAAEHGVSQQALFFKEEADKHEKSAATWRKGVWAAVAVLIAVAFASAWFFPSEAESVYSAIQLGTSKLLALAASVYALFFCAKNYLAHCHNTVVNRHRQNALMTYRALVEANKDSGNADIVLGHAARCIFSSRESGYTRGDNSNDGEVSVMRHVARGVAQGDE